MESQIHDEKSHIRCKAIIEVLGKPKEHVEDSIKDYIIHIKNDNELVILNEEFSEVKEQNSMWSQFVEIDLVVKGFGKLIGFCFQYMPSSIEVVKPESVMLSDRNISDLFNDLQGKLHSVDMVVKQQKSENDFLKKNLHTIIKNTILICLRIGKFHIDKISKITGIEKDEMGAYLDELLEEKKIKKEGDLYSLA